MTKVKTDQTHILTADEIWAAKDIEERVVPVPQWGGSVRIRTIDKLTADQITSKATRTDPHTKQQTLDNDMLVALLFVESMVEPKLDLADYENMRKKSAVAVALLQKEILDASGMSAAAVSEADKSNGAKPNASLRVLPGARAEDDSSRAATENVGA